MISVVDFYLFQYEEIAWFTEDEKEYPTVCQEVVELGGQWEQEGAVYQL